MCACAPNWDAGCIMLLVFLRKICMRSKATAKRLCFGWKSSGWTIKATHKMRKTNIKYKLNEIVCTNERAKTLPTIFNWTDCAWAVARTMAKETIYICAWCIMLLCAVRFTFSVIHVNNFSLKCCRVSLHRGLTPLYLQFRPHASGMNQVTKSVEKL